MSTKTDNSVVLQWGGYLALTLLLALIMSVVMVRAGLWQPGLILYAISCLGSAIVLLVLALSMVFPSFAGKRVRLFTRALAVLPGTVLLLGIVSAGKYPEIHDITTDMADPPVFVHVQELRGKSANSLEINAETLSMQDTAYPGIKTMHSHLELGEAFAQASAVATKMGWEVTYSDQAEGIIEAVDTTKIMAFKDDIIIRLRNTDDGTLIDLRSASRVGRSDLGANAKRIREYMARFKS